MWKVGVCSRRCNNSYKYALIELACSQNQECFFHTRFMFFFCIFLSFGIMEFNWREKYDFPAPPTDSIIMMKFRRISPATA